MRLRLGKPRTALIVAPHPDDEIIGAGGLIAALMRRGTRVSVVIVSDGAASHPASPAWPRARLVTERRRESRRALRRLGIPADQVRFLDLPDDGVDRSGDLKPRLGRCLARERPDLIVGPSGDDDHPDHRAVAHAIARRTSPARRLIYQVWPHRDRSRRRMSWAVDPRGAAGKRSLLRLYRTQLGAIRDDPAGFAIAPQELDAFARPIELFSEGRR